MPYIGNQHNVGDHVNNFKVLDDISSHTATFNGSATSVVSVADDTIRIPEHRFIQGQRVTYTNGGGGNIGGLTSGTAYYVSFDSPNTIRLATSLANANSNTVINLSSVGSGTSHTLNAAFDGINTKFKVTYASGKAARFNNATQLNVAINNVIQRPNLSAASFTEGFAIEDSHKIVFKDAPTVNDIFWGSIIANTIENFDLRDNEVNNFTGNGSTTEFTLSSIPANNESVIVTIDGVLQHPSDSTTARAYTLIDSIIQFTAAPALNAEIQVRHIGFAGASTNDVSGFYGRTGNVALTANDHITTGDLTSRNINASGILTASSASFGGNVSIGGTLTYEDVTNIDAVGIITARSTIDAQGSINLADSIIHTGDTDTKIRFPSADTITAETAGSERLRISSSGKVGIGTNNPLQKLHVTDGTSANIYIETKKSDTGSTAGLYYKTSSSTASDFFKTGIVLEDDGTSHARGKLHILQNNTADGSNATLSDSVVTFTQDGKVGINTISPTEKLTVLGNILVKQFAGTEAKIQINETTTTNPLTLKQTATESLIQTGASQPLNIRAQGGSGSNSYLAFWTRDDERLRITPDGKIGIGTDNPGQLLHLYSSNPVIRFTDTDYHSSSSSNINGTNGNLYFDTVNSNRDIIFRGATTEVARVTGDGKLGIGTNNPTYPIEVWNSDPRIQLVDTDLTTNRSVQLRNNQGSAILSAATHTSFYNSGNERVRIKSTGQVGIGSISPEKQLVVRTGSGSDGGILVKPDVNYASNQDRAYLMVGTDGFGLGGNNWNNYGFQHRIKSNSSGTARVTIDTSGGEAFCVESGGNIGIGTNDPVRPLHIHAADCRIRLEDAGVATDVELQNSSGDAVLTTNGASNVRLQTNNEERLRINQDGKVGIGTDNPSALLHIFSDANNMIMLESTDRYSTMYLIDTIGSSYVQNDSGTLRFGTGGGASAAGGENERLRITSAGKVSIGNESSPLGKLHVKEGDSGVSSADADQDTLFLENNGNAGLTIATPNANTGYLTFADPEDSNVGQIIYRHGGTNANSMGFFVNTAERLRIDSDGDLIHKSLNKTLSLVSTQNASQAGTKIAFFGADRYDTDEEFAAIKGLLVSNSGGSGKQNGGLQFIVGSSSHTHAMTQGGYVGFGTANPQSQLHISSGTSGDCVLIIESDTDNDEEGDNCRIEFKQDGGSSQSAIETGNNELILSNSVSSNGGIVFKTGTTSPYTNATEALRIHSNGNVMIGSGTPSTQLHVKNSSSVVRVESTSTSTSARVEITGASNSYSGLHFGDTSDVDNGYIRYYNADNYFIIGTAAAERVRIYGDGRVNIGGTNEVQLESGSEAILYLHGAIVGANVDFAFGQRIVLDDDDTGTATADRERGSIYAQFNGNASGGDTSDETRAWNIYSDLNVNADYDNAYGVYADVRANFTSGTSSAMRGVYGLCQTQSSGQITEMIGVYGISQTTTGASSVTLNDLVGIKGRANMCAGTSTANAIDLVGVWGNIDNDNNTAQATGGKCALFYGNYDKTNGLHNPQGIRIDTSVPNYFRGAIAINGGGNFLPTGNNAIHIKDNTNATGIFLEQTGDQYNVIKGSANRSGQDNAIIDIQGYWNTTQVGRIRIDTGTDTTNKDDGRIQFFTASGGNLNEVMQIQENGEIAMDSAGSPSDALANLHVQNETFRVSNHSQTGSYIHLRAWESGDDGDRATIMIMANNVPKFNTTRQGQVFGSSTHYAGRARTDANSPTDYYSHGPHGYYAYSGRTDSTSAYRSRIYMRAWDQGDHGDRTIIEYADSGNDTDTTNNTSDLRFVVKADGRVQGKGGSFFAGRVESDNANPTDYFQNGERGFQAYGNDADDETYILARNVADNQNIFYTEVNGEPNAKIQADGDAFTDGTWSNDNADYAEMFEWSDGNTFNEERRGMTVVLDGDKIRLATDSDNKDNIIGVVSVNPVVLGDSAPLGWHGRYKKDVFGSPVRKAHEFLVWNRGYREVDGVSVLFKQPDPNDPRSYSKCERCPVEEIDERKAKGEIPDYAIENNIRITTYAKEIDTETYDSTKKYIPRLDRKEWDAIGLVGKLIIKRGQPIGSRWILMKSNIGTDPNDSSIILDKYLVR